VDGQKFRQSLSVALDPRVHVNPGDLEAQLQVALMIDDWMNTSYRAYNDLAGLRTALAEALKIANNDGARASLQTSDKLLAELQEGTPEAPGFGAVNRDVTRFVSMIQSGDARPARSIVENATPSCIALKNSLARYRKLQLETFHPPTVPDDPRCPN